MIFNVVTLILGMVEKMVVEKMVGYALLLQVLVLCVYPEQTAGGSLLLSDPY